MREEGAKDIGLLKKNRSKSFDLFDSAWEIC